MIRLSVFAGTYSTQLEEQARMVGNLDHPATWTHKKLAMSTREVLTQEGYLKEGSHGNWVDDKSVIELWVTARTSTQTQGWQMAVWAQPGHLHRNGGGRGLCKAQPGQPHRHRGWQRAVWSKARTSTQTQRVGALSGHQPPGAPLTQAQLHSFIHQAYSHVPHSWEWKALAIGGPAARGTGQRPKQWNNPCWLGQGAVSTPRN